MEYIVKRSHRKTIQIAIRDGLVIVNAPHMLSQKAIDAIVLSKKEWIKKKLDLYRPSGIDLRKTSFFYYGKEVPIHLSHTKQTTIHLDESLQVGVKETDELEKIQTKIENSLKAELYDYLDQRVEMYADKLKIKKPPFKIRRYKRMHGRCSQNGELAFNLYLFHEHPDFIDYVVLHECAHILEFNHSAKFYAIIKAHMPNYKDIIALSKR